MTNMYSDNRRATHLAPISGGCTLVSPEKSRSWGPMSVGVFHRASGEVSWLSDYISDQLRFDRYLWRQAKRRRTC